MSSEQHVIVSFIHRHERITNIANELDAFLGRCEEPFEMTNERELHKLRGYCEQLRCDAESLKNGADGFGKGVEEVTNE
jgi:hypothetical protein